jgi:uncharacterized protein (DUF488 family)
MPEFATNTFPNWAGDENRESIPPNTAWRNEAFRGYADYMETAAFSEGLDRLNGLADKAGPTALMCAEAVWWRCHRALISDLLKARGTEVIHILDAKKTEQHPFTSAARMIDGHLSYRTEETLL